METATDYIQQRAALAETDWNNRQAKHETRVSELLDDYLEARSRHEKNPVMDFLFEYYAFRPSNLRKWSPGLNTPLHLTRKDLLPELDELVVSEETNTACIRAESFPEKRYSSLKWMLGLLENSAAKRPSFGCFGMHEWAMVYKAGEVRHSQVPLRMEEDELAAFVESRPLLCTHFDAFRFFTPEARPMNRHDLSRETFQDMEQPGCIHSNMDLYKWAFKLYPWVGSDLLMQAFELALEARTVDMQASPYDLQDHGLEPIRIETEDGRKEYREKQEALYQKGIPIRNDLIYVYRELAGELNLI